VLGVLVLGHYSYRFFVFYWIDNGSGSEDIDMGFDSSSGENVWQLLSFAALHILLQISSFGFWIPRKRHPDGFRIYPEYRAHALLFMMRSLVLVITALCRKASSEYKSKLSSRGMLWNAVVVVGNMAIVDLVSKYFSSRGESSSTIRGLRAPDAVLFIMSSAQFHATMNCLLTTDRASVQIAAMAVVQCSSFGLTLQRKRIISKEQGLFLYTFVLYVGMTVIVDDLMKRNIFHAATFGGNIAAILRMNLSFNKYLLWTLACVFGFVVCLHGDDSIAVPIPMLSRMSTLLVLISALLRFWRKGIAFEEGWRGKTPYYR